MVMHHDISVILALFLAIGCSNSIESTEKSTTEVDAPVPVAATARPINRGPLVLKATRSFAISSATSDGRINFQGPPLTQLPKDASELLVRRAKYLASDGSVIAANVTVTELKPAYGDGTIWTLSAAQPLPRNSSFRLTVASDSALLIEDALIEAVEGQPWVLNMSTASQPAIAGTVYDKSTRRISIVMTEPVTWSADKVRLFANNLTVPVQCLSGTSASGCNDATEAVVSEQASFQLAADADVSEIQIRTEATRARPASIVRAALGSWRSSPVSLKRVWRANP